jgi:hypothetical protein
LKHSFSPLKFFASDRTTTNALRFARIGFNVHVNMFQQNGELPALPEPSKRKGNYTGERLKTLRPATYRRVVELLAEPREHVSIREICRQCHVTDDTVKAVEGREAIPIAARKQELAVQAARIAKLAYDRVEDQIDSAPLQQAVVTAGVFTDKLHLLSTDANAPLVNWNVNIQRVDLVAQFEKLHAAIREKAKENASIPRHQLALTGGETTADSSAETGLAPSNKRLKTS